MTEAFGTVALFVVFFFVAALASTLLGAFTGWVVGLLLGDAILGVAGQIGLRGISMWQFGAFLGFVGSFFRSIKTGK